MALVVASPSDGTAAGPRKTLEDAVEDFQGSLTDDERRKLMLIGGIQEVHTIMIFTTQLECENRLRKGNSIASRLFPVLQSVQAFSTVVDTFVSSHPEIAALVWGTIKFTLLVGDGVAVHMFMS